MPGEPTYSDEQLDAALDALSEAERFRNAESLVARAAPKLQLVLASALSSSSREAVTAAPSAPQTAVGCQPPS